MMFSLAPTVAHASNEANIVAPLAAALGIGIAIPPVVLLSYSAADVDFDGLWVSDEVAWWQLGGSAVGYAAGLVLAGAHEDAVIPGLGLTLGAGFLLLHSLFSLALYDEPEPSSSMVSIEFGADGYGIGLRFRLSD